MPISDFVTMLALLSSNVLTYALQLLKQLANALVILCFAGVCGNALVGVCVYILFPFF